MPETTQASDFDKTIEFLKQDLTSVDLALALNYITQWENQLQGTDIFRDFMELKQTLLDGNLTELQNTLQALVKDTMAIANDVRMNGNAEIAAKVEQIGQLLSQVSDNVK